MNGSQTAELTANDGAADDRLGWWVAVSGNTIVAGAPAHQVGSNTGQGAAYAFVMPAGGWVTGTQTAEVTASDGQPNDELGWSVGISGNTIVAGPYSHRVGSNTSQGAVYAFVMPAGGWVNDTQTAELTASDGAANDELGDSVAVSGDTVVAGALGHQVGANTDQGAAYVFVMPPAGWANNTQSAELTASNGASNSFLGQSVGIAGDTIVAGAPGVSTDQGAVYAFVMPAGGWVNGTQAAELTASDGAAHDSLGYDNAVSVSGTTIAAGAHNHQVGANTDQGAAYAFTPPVPPSVTITSPAGGGSYGEGQVIDAAYACTAGSGATISSCRGPVADGAPIDTSTTGEHTFTVTATDNLGQSTSQTVRYTVAAPVVTPPSIEITTPADGGRYTLGEVVHASYACTAGAGATIVSCRGPVASGAAIATTTVGVHTFTVTATDNLGQSTRRAVSYTVVGPKLTLVAQRDHVSRAGALKLTASCAGSPCSGRLTLTVKVKKTIGTGRRRHTTTTTVAIASRAFSLLRIGRDAISLKLAARGLRLLTAHGFTLSTTAHATLTSGSKTTSAAVRLKGTKPRRRLTGR